MKYLKMEEGWKIIETGEFIRFGEIAISQYNFFKKLMVDYNTSYLNIFEQYGIQSPEMKKFKEENQPITDRYDDIEFFIALIETHIFSIKENKFNPIRDFSICNKSRYSTQEQKVAHQKVINLIKDNGWEDISNNKTINAIDIFLIKELSNAPTFPITYHFVNGKWYFAFDTELTQQEWFVLLDIQEIRNADYDFSFCKQCGNIFIKRKKNNIYCESCSENYRKNYDQKRTVSPKGYRDKVRNYMRNSLKFTNSEIIEFSIESDKKLNTLSGEDFIKWCTEKHEAYKQEAKTRKKI